VGCWSVPTTQAPTGLCWGCSFLARPDHPLVSGASLGRGPWMGPPGAGQVLLWVPPLLVPRPDLACLALLYPTPQNRGGGRRRGTPRVPGRFRHHRVCGDAPTLSSVGCFLGGTVSGAPDAMARLAGSTERPGSYSVPQLPPQGDRRLWTKAFLKITPSGLHLCDLRRANNTCRDWPDYSWVPHQGAGQAPHTAPCPGRPRRLAPGFARCGVQGWGSLQA